MLALDEKGRRSDVALRPAPTVTVIEQPPGAVGARPPWAGSRIGWRPGARAGVQDSVPLACSAVGV